jgi:hypothetical protein
MSAPSATYQQCRHPSKSDHSPQTILPMGSCLSMSHSMAQRSSRTSPLYHSSLPSELWHQIYTYLPCFELTQLCRVSSITLRIARPILYHSVCLTRPVTELGGYGDENALTTVELLKSDEELRGCVRELVLKCQFQYPYGIVRVPPSDDKRPPSIVDPDLLSGLTRLEHLSFEGRILTNLNEELKVKLLKVLSQLSLKSLKIVYSGENLGLSAAELASISIVRLERIEVEGAIGPGPVWAPLIHSSQSSLTHITLITHELTRESTLQLFTLTFPRLRSLILGEWHPTHPEFLRFVIAHSDTLHHLGLGYDRQEIGATDFGRNDGALPLLSPSVLPHLQSLNGKATVLRVLALAGVKSLETELRTLCVGSGELFFGGWQIGYDRLFLALEASPVKCLSAVRELFLDMTDWIYHKREAASVLVRFSRFIAPSLEVWNGGLPRVKDGWTTEELCALFERFPRLRVLYLREVPGHEEGETSYYEPEGVERMPCEEDVGGGLAVRELAGRCPLLERVYQYQSDFGINAGWRVIRDIGGCDGEEKEGRIVGRRLRSCDMPRLVDNAPVGLGHTFESY